MIKSAASSAARLSLAPARIAARLAGSVVRLLGVGGTAERQQARSTTPSTPASRSRTRAQSSRSAGRGRATTQSRRASTSSRAKAQPRRTTSGTRAKSRTTSGTRAKSQQARSRQRKRPDDAAIARKVESTIFRNGGVERSEIEVQVAEGVVSLRGKVPSRELINELEARATRLSEVRRVENQLQVAETPTPAPSEVPPARPETSRPQTPPGQQPTTAGETRDAEQGAASDVGLRDAVGQAEERAAVPSESAGEATASAPEAAETPGSAERDEPESAGPESDRSDRPSDPT